MTPSLPVPLGRVADLELARRWAASVTGSLHFMESPDTRSGEFFTYITEKETAGQRRVRVKYLTEIEIQSQILAFLMGLSDMGANIKISPAKIRSVRTLASLLLLNGGSAK